MALTGSGQISMNDIRIELGVPSESPFGINEARLGTYVAINQFSASKPPSSGTVSLSDWYSYSQTGGSNSDTFYYDASSAATACAGTPNTTLYWSGSLGIGTVLYTDSLGTSEASQGYWSDDTNAYFQNCPDGCGDGITSITACVETATLSWTYSVTGAPSSNAMDIRVNSSTEISRTSTSSGTYTVYVGDTIDVIISLSGCSGGSAVANAYTDGIIMDAACTPGNSSATLNSTTYTVVSGDIGNTISLDCYAQCDGGCL